MLVGGIRGAFTAGVTMAGNKIAEDLTGNDREYLQKSEAELEERREKEKEEQEEGKKMWDEVLIIEDLDGFTWWGETAIYTRDVISIIGDYLNT